MPNVIIAASNLNMPRREALLGGRRSHQEFLEQTGLRADSEIDNLPYKGGGFEWSEVRNIRSLMMARLALQLAAQGDIISMHQSWRSTHMGEIALRYIDPKGSWDGRQNTKANVTNSLKIAAAIPYISTWADRLLPIQTAAGRKLPVIAHPNEQQPPEKLPRFNFDYPSIAGQFAALRHQPTIETLQRWRVASTDTEMMVDDMLAVQPDYGFTEVAFDTRHAYGTRQGMRLEDPLGMVSALAKRDALPELQINLTNDPEMLRYVLDNGLENTYHGEMITEALDNLPPERDILIVSEVAEHDFHHKKVGMNDVADGNKQIIQAIARIACG